MHTMPTYTASAHSERARERETADSDRTHGKTIVNQTTSHE